MLRHACCDCDIVDALFVLERLRSQDAGTSWAARVASEASSPRCWRRSPITGRHDQAEFTEALRQEEINRGLVFDYCLITAGTSLNRAPSEQRLGWRHLVPRLRWQLSRLCRRHLPHGHARRAGRRAGRFAGLYRGIQRCRAEAGQAGAGAARFMTLAKLLARDRRTATTPISWRTAWASSATRRRG